MLAAFLDAKAGLAFDIRIAEETITVVSETYNIAYLQDGVQSLSAQFRRVYEQD